MKEIELTGWFPAVVKPVHAGVYKTKLEGWKGSFLVGYSFWTGREWKCQLPDPQQAYEHRDEGGFQDKPWKGLRKEPQQNEVVPK